MIAPEILFIFYLNKLKVRMIIKSLKQVKKIIIGIVGFSVLLVGVAMLVLPGPAFIVIPAGLAILATEFVWAKKLLNKVKDTIKEKLQKSQQTTTSSK